MRGYLQRRSCWCRKFSNATCFIYPIKFHDSYFILTDEMSSKTIILSAEFFDRILTYVKIQKTLNIVDLDPFVIQKGPRSESELVVVQHLEGFIGVSDSQGYLVPNLLRSSSRVSSRSFGAEREGPVCTIPQEAKYPDPRVC